MNITKPTWHAFTNHYTGRCNRLITKAFVAEAFDPQKVDHKTVKHVETDALWDTGATHSVITPSVVKKLNLQPIGKIKVRHGGGEGEEYTYVVNLVLPNGVAISGITMSGMDKVVDNFGIIIGMDVISLGDFSMTNHKGNTCFSFRFPSQGQVDYVEQYMSEIKKGQSQILGSPLILAGMTPKMRPNDNCFCNSGKKFKKCHGARA